MEENNKSPDFNLAPMKSFDPKIFMSYKNGQEDLESVDAFIITLGLIFNDLKGLFWWNKQVDKNIPDNLKKVSENVGEYSGMRMQNGRLLLGLLAELLNTINKNEEAMKHPLFKRTIKNLRSQASKSWADILAAARKKDSQIKRDKKLFSLIQEVRNNGAFHYENTDEIHKGYKSFFSGEFTSAMPDFHLRAYYSLGETLFKTRFYFSDAAIDGYSRSKAKNFNKTYGELDISKFITESLLKISPSIRFIVEEYIELRKYY